MFLWDDRRQLFVLGLMGVEVAGRVWDTPVGLECLGMHVFEKRCVWYAISCVEERVFVFLEFSCAAPG